MVRDKTFHLTASRYEAAGACKQNEDERFLQHAQDMIATHNLNAAVITLVSAQHQ